MKKNNPGKKTSQSKKTAPVSIQKTKKSTPRRGVEALPLDLMRILVPIDFSEHSKTALRYAVRFARAMNASIDLLYVIEPMIYPADFSFGQVGYPNVEEELYVRGTNELKKLMAKEVGGSVPAKAIVRTGKAFYEITQYAEEQRVDLIIICTHGHTGMEHILFGSTAEKVVRKAPCTVLVYREGKKSAAPTNGE
jgi:nucleotide-binding universal stress UspA family protein